MATGPVKGMDFDAVEQWGGKITNSAVDSVRQMVRGFCNEANNLQWSGSDFESFKSQQVMAVENALKSLETALGEMGQTAVRNANAQRTTSQAV